MTEAEAQELRDSLSRLDEQLEQTSNDVWTLSEERDRFVYRLEDLEHSHSGIARLEQRVSEALLDIQGVNLEQRIALAAEQLMNRTLDMTRDAAPGRQATEAPEWNTVAPLPSLWSPNRVDNFTQPMVYFETSDRPADGGTGEVVDQFDDGAGNIVTVYDSVEPDEGAGQSEAASPEQVT